MNAERWQKVRAVFETVVELAPEEQKRRLDKSCGADDELRRAVENLLASSENSESFLEQPAVVEVASIIVESPNALPTGTIFGHYEILRQIGAGGMGEVYLANDKKLDRLVAVKILGDKFAAHESNLRRFIQEAKAASALNHPNILVIHEIGTENETNYIVSEYIEGETLREKMVGTGGSGLSLAEVLDISIQIANALVAAHAARIVHRDIKPENIIVRPDGLVKVLDFGLAKLVERKTVGIEESAGKANETAQGIILGTVNYMSPEQAKGEKVDERSDIFSFGAVLYEMIAGDAPFAGDSMSETFANLINREPPLLNRFSSDMPDELNTIVARTLRKNKTERYQTMRDLLFDLKSVRRADSEFQRTFAPHRTKPEAQNTVALTDNAARTTKRTKISLKIALALSVFAVAAVGLWLFLGRQNLFTAIEVQKTSQLTIQSGLDDFPSLAPNGNSVAYCSDQTGSFEIYVKALTPGANEIQLTNDGNQNFQPAWSPDGQRIAYHSKMLGGIWMIPASGGAARQLAEFGSHPAWSPDGKQLAFQSNPLIDLGAFARNALPPSTLWLLSVESGESKPLTQIGNPVGGHGAPSFSPDGTRIAFEVNDYNSANPWTISADGTDAKPLSKAARGYEPVFAPDGKSVLYATYNGVFQMRLDPETGETHGEPMLIPRLGGGLSSIKRVSFSANGKKLSYSASLRRETLASIRLRTDTMAIDGAIESLVRNTNARNNFPAFSPDGERVAFTTCNIGGTNCDIWLMNADGSDQTPLTTNENNELIPSWFPDMQRIAYVSNRTGRWTLWAINLNTKRETMLLDLKDDLEYARLSPDGKRIVFNFKGDDGVINVWTAALADGEPRQLTFDQSLMGFPAWSPDGKSVAFQMKRGDDTHIMVMPSEGGTPTQLTFDKGQSWIYDWSPDGDKILYAAQRDGFWNVRWVSRSTRKQRQLTDYKGLNSFVRYPAWSPKAGQIVYEYSETTGNIWIADLK